MTGVIFSKISKQARFKRLNYYKKKKKNRCEHPPYNLGMHGRYIP